MTLPIENDHQYEVTKAQAQKFALALEEFDARNDIEVDPILRRAQREAIEAQLTELREELESYDSRRGDP